MDEQLKLKEQCEKLLFDLQTKYQHQDISEFSRVEDALSGLIKYGVWPTVRVEMKQCECCGELYLPETREMPQPENHIQAACQMMNELTFGSVCDAKECQAFAQAQCDQFDMDRKGEY